MVTKDVEKAISNTWAGELMTSSAYNLLRVTASSSSSPAAGSES